MLGLVQQRPSRPRDVEEMVVKRHPGGRLAREAGTGGRDTWWRADPKGQHAQGKVLTTLGFVDGEFYR